MEDTEHTQRRTFLAMLAMTTAAAVDFLYPGLADAATVARTARHSGTSHQADIGGKKLIRSMAGNDPGFAGGVVVAATASGIILRSDAAVRTVLIAPESVVWKEYDVTPQAIELGDWVDVRGTPHRSGALEARSGWIWVNIGRMDGRITSSSAEAVVVTTDSGRQRTMELSRRLEVVYAKSGSPVASAASALKPGMIVGAVGLRLPDGRLRATRIWI